MDKSFKIIIYVLLAVVVINFVMNFTERSHTREVLRNLETSQKKLSSAINDIQASRTMIDSIQGDLGKFKHYINEIQKSVELMEVEKHIGEKAFKKSIDSLREKRDTLIAELSNADPLPTLVIRQ